ncbi:MAG TPA: hypothetical protein VK403_00580 [Allosphingosinicella sp.]|nr:hypothetical protein [Allosphingosinicella sp.]
MAESGRLLYGSAMEGPDTGADLAALLAEPEWLPHRIAGGGAEIEFVRLSRAEQRALPFLDERFVGESVPRGRAALADIAAARPAAESECHFIFHSAFCCSTLLARALDVDGVATVLQEPRALVDLAAALPASGGRDEVRPALDSVLALLQRPHEAGEAAILKPGNFANPLIEDLLELRPRARALLMYVPLPAFLLAIVRRGTSNRPWARRMATIFRRHPQFETTRGRDLLLLTDLQVAAWVWLHHHAQFERLVGEQPPGRIATLDAGAFLADPVRTLVEASALFRLDVDQARAEAIAAGPAFRQNAKRPGKAFDPAALKREEAAAKFAHGAEIEEAVGWAGALAEKEGIKLSLEAPLLRRP